MSETTTCTAATHPSATDATATEVSATNPGATSSLQGRMDAYWSERAAAYDAGQRRPERWAADERMWSQIWASVLPSPPARVLDLGTGTGHVALMLARLGHEVVGMDHAEGMLEVARQHAAELDHRPLAHRDLGAAAPTFVVGDAHAPEVEPGSVDAVTSRYLAWTLADPVGSMQRWRDALRPGGVMALVDSTWFTDGLTGSPEEFVSAYGPVLDELPLARASSIDPTVEAVRAAGFVDVEVRALTEVLAADEEHGAAPGHRPRLQHLVTGRRPA